MAPAAAPPYVGSMPIARRPRPMPDPDRRPHWLVALLLAALTLSAVALPALAVDPGPDAEGSPSASGSPSDPPSASPGTSTTPSAGPSTAPSDAPSASPSVSPSPSPAPSASATAAPSASLSPSVAPSPSATPAPTPLPVSAWPKTTWPTSATSLGTSVRFYGRGWGHGVGLSQYGARGRALSGQSAAQILATYFKGTTPALVSPQTPVRVLVLAGFNAGSSAPLVAHGRITDWTIDGTGKTFPKDGLLKAWRTTSTVDGVAKTTWRYRVYAADGTTLLHAATATGSLWLRGATTSSRLQLD